MFTFCIKWHWLFRSEKLQKVQYGLLNIFFISSSPHILHTNSASMHTLQEQQQQKAWSWQKQQQLCDVLMAQRGAAAAEEQGNQRGLQAKASWELEVSGESASGSAIGK